MPKLSDTLSSPAIPERRFTLTEAMKLGGPMTPRFLISCYPSEAALPRNVTLSDDTREAIREMKEKNPRLTQRELAHHFGVSDVTIHNVLTYWAKPHAPSVRMAMPPSCSIKQSESTLSPITREMLMAGNARRVRSAA